MHLAKLLPNQWRTIAPLVGRTAHQCLEHYEKLLDLAQQKEDSGIDNLDDPRRPRPGEIDPNPETKPARPDPIDMDEDEKEMLQEARARLANTKGKKAKRKAREKQLDEARRIAALQKRRELKAAGINISLRKKKTPKGTIDYAKEIPFFIDAPAGFFQPESDKSTGDERFRPTNLSKLEGEKRMDKENKLRKKDAKAQKAKKDANLPDVIMQINKLNDPHYIRKHSNLQLPAPQMTETELEDLAKLQKSNLSVSEEDEDENSITAALLANYQQTPITTPQLRAARTPARPDSIMLEAQNLAALSRSETPLKGGQNAHLNPVFTPVPTPNALATPLRTPGRGILAAGNQKAGEATIPATPVRDQLQINAGAEEDIFAQSKQVKSLFSNLPKPKNTYALVLPDLPDEPSADEQFGVVEDQRDVENRIRKQKELEQERLFRQRSTVLQRELPRANLPVKLSAGSAPGDLIQNEMRKILIHDQIHFPIKTGGSIIPKEKLEIPSFDVIDEKYLEQAKTLIHDEKEKILVEKNINVDEILSEFQSNWNDVHSESFMFSTSKNQFVPIESLSKEEQIASLSSQFELLRTRVSRDANKGKKLEQKISVYNGGYEQNATALQRDVSQLYVDIELAFTELNCFRHLQEKENFSIEKRQKELEDAVSEQKEKEKLLQKRYDDLTNKIKKVYAIGNNK